MREYNVVIERDTEGYLVATVPELAGCHTQAKSMDTVLKRIQEAISLCLEESGATDEPREFVGIQRVAI